MNGASTLSRFLDEGPSDEERTALTAWLCEAKAAAWINEKAIQVAYPQADITKPPRVVFQLLDGALAVHTLVRPTIGVLLIDQIRTRRPGQISKPNRRAAA